MLSKQKIGERLKTLREHNNEKQTDIAELLNVQRQIVSYYETGARMPNVEDLAILAKHFNTSVDYLLGITDIESTETELKAVCEYTGLSETAIKNINSIYESAKSNSSRISINRDFTNSGVFSTKSSFETLDLLLCDDNFYKAISIISDYKQNLTAWNNEGSKLIKSFINIAGWDIPNEEFSQEVFYLTNVPEDDRKSILESIEICLGEKARLLRGDYFESIERFKECIKKIALKPLECQENIQNGLQQAQSILIVRGEAINGEHN